MKRLIRWTATMASVILVLFFSTLLIAQDGSNQEMASSGLNLFYVILELCAPLITAALGWVSIKLAGLIKAKVKNETIGGILARLTTTVFTLVREAEQTIVANIKEGRDPNSPGGTKLTKAEAAQVRKAVINKLKELWGPKGLQELATILGLNEGGLSKFLEAKVEEVVHVEGRRNP